MGCGSSAEDKNKPNGETRQVDGKQTKEKSKKKEQEEGEGMEANKDNAMNVESGDTKKKKRKKAKNLEGQRAESENQGNFMKDPDNSKDEPFEAESPVEERTRKVFDAEEDKSRNGTSKGGGDPAGSNAGGAASTSPTNRRKMNMNGLASKPLDIQIVVERPEEENMVSVLPSKRREEEESLLHINNKGEHKKTSSFGKASNSKQILPPNQPYSAAAREEDVHVTVKSPLLPPKSKPITKSEGGEPSTPLKPKEKKPVVVLENINDELENMPPADINKKSKPGKKGGKEFERKRSTVQSAVPYKPCLLYTSPSPRDQA
eukprot:TRINITY_DN10019_c0_g1_i2.p1 TRINITY_DN10019_c0_g1~~TRINITY_DN10019_c0_g1_i2.p1  ORF type:complete len:318 (-),score=70.18 TRINITY_DN10019_c0_g1_i2:34-987(-)